MQRGRALFTFGLAAACRCRLLTQIVRSTGVSSRPTSPTSAALVADRSHRLVRCTEAAKLDKLGGGSNPHQPEHFGVDRRKPWRTSAAGPQCCRTRRMSYVGLNLDRGHARSFTRHQPRDSAVCTRSTRRRHLPPSCTAIRAGTDTGFLLFFFTFI